MKLSIKKLTIVFFGILTISCSEDFLELAPTDQYTVDTFWTSEENATAALTGCYHSLLNGYGFQGFWGLELEMVTPNAWSYDNLTGSQAIAQGTIEPDNQLVNQRYQWAYEGIGRTNVLLANIDEVPMEEALKSQYKAEAQFLRAFFYHNLVEFFGGVPLILEAPDNNTQGQLPRNSKDEVVSAVINDLDAAASVLPESYENNGQGRATRGAALALKARTLLYNERWSEAKDAAQAVIDLGVYSLFPDYRGMFLLENEGNSEVIFDVQFQQPEFTNNYHANIILANRVAPLKDLVDAYLMTDGEPITESPLYDPDNPYENRDPRLQQTIVVPGSTFNSTPVVGEEAFLNTTGFSMKKYTYFEDDVERTPPGNNNAAINPIVIRYAEVLLTLAEAENEINGPTDLAYDAINQIRSRPTVEMPPVNPGLSKEAFREMLRLERRIEFAGEGLYYKDILRWGIAEEVMNAEAKNIDGVTIENRSFDPDRDYLWPIPARDIILNPNLDQNPGY